MKDFVKRLHEKGIYVIGRITVFQDPYYTKLHPAAAVQSAALHPGQPWRDNKGLSFIDVSHQVILYIEGVSVSFDGFKALNDLNLYINDGELRCLIGANGAGKTTLMDVITGKTLPDSGNVYFGHCHCSELAPQQGRL